ncbi:fimbrial protein [Haemophilus influenzae biotype aegyptius]|uniref:Major fimbrial subunit n=2 Tax=Haemophilus influenzae TaxID=727 RepID=A0AAV2U5Z2_HAEIF|nr:type 1 fimbrial protein [Haemophilus influenzae biotype aegyptius]CBY80726.1 Major fimbrial subunit [Haemophilus influenzae F3031]CBY86869.1 Major fimbrial subunit [Haemophilus influenzae F3047]QEQ61568.1 type 1 fimbrial protein [Haemophilus influenzae biotype aegyptius]QEQ62933.1 type 1 fimbrial protein [Haemophilus influenzae biotype aegyptius]
MKFILKFLYRIFKMKKTILALLALGVFGANSAFAAAVTTQNQDKTHAKVKVIGEVVTQTCEISSNEKNKMVKLDTVGTNSLVNKGDVATQQLVTFHLQNCSFLNGVHTPSTGNNPQTSQNKVTVTFNHTEKVDINNEYTLKNIAQDNKANNVNIQFADINGKGIRLGQNDNDAKLRAVSIDNNQTPQIHFLARYYATSQSTPGKVEAEAELDLAYE